MLVHHTCSVIQMVRSIYFAHSRVWSSEITSSIIITSILKNNPRLLFHTNTFKIQDYPST